jgi:transcriptional regulator with XRE-family HTH domain
MKKNEILKHLREITQTNVSELSFETGISENHIRDIEKNSKIIPHKLIAYYSSRLKVDISIMEALLGDITKSHHVFFYLQNIAVSIILKYLELGQWMCAYNGQIKE